MGSLREIDLTNYKDQASLLKMKGSIKKIFFYRMCGTGMGATAGLFKSIGLEVSGADQNFYPPMSDYLQSLEIECLKMDDLDLEYLKSFDLIVIGNVVPRNSEEAKKLEQLGVPFCSFPAAMGAFILSDKNKVLGIAGTHGKTTTTYLFTQVFENLGVDPGYFIGGVIDGRNSSKLGKSDYFFIESDEYDSAYFEKFSKFHQYQLNHLVITSLEFDHADIFNSIEDIKNEFKKLIPEVSGQLIFANEYTAIKDISKARSEFYGDNSELGPIVSHMDESGTRFSLVLNGLREEFDTKVSGLHNIKNLTTVILFAIREGFSLEKIREAIFDLSMVKRRQEIKGKYKRSIIVDDFAHHPKAVEVTIDWAKIKFRDKKIVAILEPASATARSSLFQNEFEKSLGFADETIIIDPKKVSTAKNANDLDFNKLVINLNKNHNSTLVSTLDELIKQFDRVEDENVILLVMSNSSCLGLWKNIELN